jgi:hypothetical protein
MAATLLSIYQLRIVLRGVSPLIWRRVLVHSDTTLAHLHAILQILFAWSLALTGSVISVSKRSCLWHCDGSIRCVLEANGRHPLRTAGAPGAIWSGLISIRRQ